VTAPDPDRPHFLWAQVEYDGTDFQGFQIQAQGRTVQGEIERALQKLTQVPTRVVGAGRTDSGVHARGQMIAFRVRWRHRVADLHRGLNAVLPADLSLPKMAEAPAGFHPRFSAVARMYRYTVWTGEFRSPLVARYAHHEATTVNRAAMQQAAQCVIGTHDFAAFGRAPQGENTHRQVMRADWSHQGQFLTFDIEANAFLYRMVRSLVGTMLWVGTGRLPPGAVEHILASADRSLAAPPAPACGLCLMQVIYPEGVLQ
jgi:tRNA pseudouridine38-40 synthase